MKKINRAMIEPILAHNLGKCRLEIYDEIDSTNMRAKELYFEGERKALVIAEAQTKGRGRLGRSFYSPKESGIYMSLLFEAGIEAVNAVKVTTFAAVAVARAIERVSGLSAGIKWVNDIYINGKKVCGILTEAGSSNQSSDIDYIILGIGINVYGKDFPEDIKEIATSIEAELNSTDAITLIDRNCIIAEILKEMKPFILGGAEDCLSEYRKRSVLIGKQVKVISGKEEYSALVVGIDAEFALEVEPEALNGTVGGQRRSINAGEVSVKLR